MNRKTLWMVIGAMLATMALLVMAANPDFRSFNTNQFGTAGSTQVSISDGSLQTNIHAVKSISLTGGGFPGLLATNTGGNNNFIYSNFTYTVSGTNAGFRLLPFMDFNQSGTPVWVVEDSGLNIVNFSGGDFSLIPGSGTGRFIGNGSLLTALNGSQILSGTVPPAQLGSGTASSTTALFGDSTYKPVLTQAQSATNPVFVAIGPTNVVITNTSGTLVDALGQSNDFEGSLRVVGGADFGSATNEAATASTVAKYDANKTLTSIANGTGVLTNDGSGTLSWVPVSGGGSPTIPLNLSTNGDGTTVQRGISVSNSAAAISGGAQAYSPSIDLYGHSSDNAGVSQPSGFHIVVSELDRTGAGGSSIGRLQFYPDVPSGGVALGTFYFQSDGSLSLNGFTLSSGGTANFPGNIVGGGTLTGVSSVTASAGVTARHFIGTGSPTVVTNAGAGGGTGTVTLDASANDSGMVITLNTGSSPATSSTILTVSFGTAYANVPHIVFCPANSTDAILSGASSVFLDTVGTGSFTLKSGSTALTGSTTYKWSVVIIQ